MPTIAKRATTELVAIAWLRDLVGDIVATTVPRPGEDGIPTWADTGFVTVHTSGGSTNLYVPMRMPVVLIDCWAVSPNSVKPPWNRATVLAESIVAGCLDHESNPRLLTLSAGYPNARVLSAYTVQEPRRPVVPGGGEASADLGSWARIVMALQLHWVEVGS
ncbi:hypothetical protein [Streptomyces microflavus]|uniref:hypothetical protein n=1 Tax=Streptomyces microflavus TaxID=1919 RepID=UPI002E320E33|nr:hypothetical protein [Streptomyces microflavus]